MIIRFWLISPGLAIYLINRQDNAALLNSMITSIFRKSAFIKQPLSILTFTYWKILGTESFTRWFIWGTSTSTSTNTRELGRIAKFLPENA